MATAGAKLRPAACGVAPGWGLSGLWPADDRVKVGSAWEARGFGPSLRGRGSAAPGVCFGGSDVVLKAAWLLLAPTVALALSEPAVAQGGPTADDPIRRQAEELAKEASKKFGEVLQGQGKDAAVATAGRQASQPPERSLGLLVYWLDYSEHQYRGIIRRLALDGAHWGWDPGTVGWLKRSNQEFQGIMQKLARAGGPARQWDPVADAEARHRQGAPAPTPPPQASPGGEVAAGERRAPRPGDGQPKTQDASHAEAPSRVASAEPPRQGQVRPEGAEGPARAKQARGEAPPEAGGRSRQRAAATRAAAAKTKTDDQAVPSNDRHGGPAAPAANPMIEKSARAPGSALREAPATAVARGREAPTPRSAEPSAAALQASKAAEENARLAAAAAPSRAATPAEDGSATRARDGVAVQRRASSIAQRPGSTQKASKGSQGQKKRKGRRGPGEGSQRCALAGVAASLPGWYVTKAGDSLWTIAKRHYGSGARYRRIYAANRSRLLKGPDWILPCQRLYLPRQRRHGSPPDQVQP